MISPLAYVDASAKLGANVTVHPFAYIDKNVVIGDDCEIMPHASIMSGTRMGKRNRVFNGAVIAAEPQDFQYKGGDTIAKKCLEEHCSYLGHGIAGFINIFSPQRVVIGGGLSEAGDFYIDMVRQQALKHAMADCAVNTTIMAAKLGNKAGSMGAAWMVFSSIE